MRASRHHALAAAYTSTRYEVEVQGERVIMRVGLAPAPALCAALQSLGARTAAFLTAWNPGSVARDRAANERCQRALYEAIRAAGFTWFEGQGIEPGGSWPAEHSVLVIGIGRAAATGLAETFGQNAYLWVDIEKPVELAYTSHWHAVTAAE